MLIAMTIGSVVVLGALGLLQFTTSDVSRISARVHVDQTGRGALEKIMLELHSACVAPSIIPIRPESSASKLRFISETTPVNEHGEPVSALSKVKLHEILYTPAAGKVQGTLVEKSWPSTGTAPAYKFAEGETPTKVTLLTGVQQSVNAGKEVPVFQYYRYYHEGDAEPTYGKLNPNSTGAVKELETKYITKVTVSFTLAPEGSESATFGRDRPVALEDSAIFRLSPSSEASSNSNLPCAER
jgi:hypothetical protein